MLFKSKRDKISFQKNMIMFFILFFTCNNLFSEKITDYVNKKDVQNVNKIFIYREEKKQKKEETKKENVTETVRSYSEYLPKYFPLVHPSPLNIRWMKKNPWFEEEVLPELKMIVKNIIKKGE